MLTHMLVARLLIKACGTRQMDLSCTICHSLVSSRVYILLRRRGHATPIVTVQKSKFFSVTKNSNIAQVRARANTAYRTCSKKIVTLKNFDGCTSCMPSSPKEYIHPWCDFVICMSMCAWCHGFEL